MNDSSRDDDRVPEPLSVLLARKYMQKFGLALPDLEAEMESHERLNLQTLFGCAVVEGRRPLEEEIASLRQHHICAEEGAPVYLNRADGDE